jgi:2-hydroxychromene-2-carboxylate isomerase
VADPAPLAPTQPIFYYDLGNPECYLVAERIMAALPVVPEWEPVLEPMVGEDRGEVDRRVMERRAVELELQPIRWPTRWPPDTQFAMLAATYAKRVGRAVAFSLAAFRQAFAAGRDLADQDTVLIAAAACEMHPAAVLKGAALRSVAVALEQAGLRGRAVGARSLPAIQVGTNVYEGDRGLDQAVQALGASP